MAVRVLSGGGVLRLHYVNNNCVRTRLRITVWSPCVNGQCNWLNGWPSKSAKLQSHSPLMFVNKTGSKFNKYNIINGII